MNPLYLTPKETIEALIASAQKKASLTVKNRFLLSIMAGIYIALGAQGFLVTYDSIFIRSAVFPVGLMLIVLVGGELFTGNCLMTIALLQKRIKIKIYVNTLLQVLIGNLIGGLAVAGLLYFSGTYNNPLLTERLVKIANDKLSLTFVQVIFKGILCNILVSLAVWFAATSNDTSGKLLGCWFPVMLFVFCGYEHVVANMFYLPMAAIFDSSITMINIVVKNLIPAAIGNYIGGGILIPFIYNGVYLKS